MSLIKASFASLELTIPTSDFLIDSCTSEFSTILVTNDFDDPCKDLIPLYNLY
jgi:hypothetical protein